MLRIGKHYETTTKNLTMLTLFVFSFIIITFLDYNQQNRVSSSLVMTQALVKFNKNWNCLQYLQSQKISLSSLNDIDHTNMSVSMTSTLDTTQAASSKGEELIHNTVFTSEERTARISFQVCNALSQPKGHSVNDEDHYWS